VSAPRRILIVGAGIGGLTAALALRRAGFAVTVIEAAPQLEEVGAGVQLSPNASAVLISLGLGPALAPHVVAPESLRVMNMRSGREIARAPLGGLAARYGAPFWVIHRGDLQRVLATAVAGDRGIDLHLGVRVQDFAQRNDRVVVVGRGRIATVQMDGDALVAADGLWSVARERLGIAIKPTFYRQTAWRALLPLEAAPAGFRQAETTLWLGPHAHVVQYPVSGGARVNVVAIIREDWDKQVWSEPGDPATLHARAARWAPALRTLIEAPQRWEKWALHDHPPLPQWGVGPVTLLGDAAHAMRPFLAQGAAMAIEDAAVLARCLAARPDNPAHGLRAYETLRQPRTARVQAEATRQGRRYGMRGPFAVARNFVLRRMGGERMLARYDWVYGWKDA
jgi:salicylate hydroxylase